MSPNSLLFSKRSSVVNCQNNYPGSKRSIEGSQQTIQSQKCSKVDLNESCKDSKISIGNEASQEQFSKSLKTSSILDANKIDAFIDSSMREQLETTEENTVTFNKNTTEERRMSDAENRSRNRFSKHRKCDYSPERVPGGTCCDWLTDSQIKNQQINSEFLRGGSERNPVIVEENPLEFYNTPDKNEYYQTKKNSRRGFISSTEQNLIQTSSNQNDLNIMDDQIENGENVITTSEFRYQNINNYSSEGGFDRSPITRSNKNQTKNSKDDVFEMEIRSPSKLVREEIFEKFDLKERPNTVTACNNKNMTNQYFSSNITYKSTKNRRSHQVNEKETNENTLKEQLL